ncbi:MAG: beta-lactamase family protein [Gemmatimonadetes bacterium]|nr:beta-lactamase family protein [Gemmatimonadota bacterium]
MRATLLLLAAACAHPRAATPTDDRALASVHSPALDSLDARVPGWLADWPTPALAVGYARDGSVQWTRTWGEAAPGVPAGPTTLWNVASVTKPVFAEVMLRLVDEGAFALDAPMAPAYVDRDLAGDARVRTLTPRLALSHRMGLPNWRYETAGTLRFIAEPGQGFHYSGEGYEYLRRYAQAATHQSLDAMAQRVLFGPAGMHATAFAPPVAWRALAAQPHDGNDQWLPRSFADSGNAADDLHWTIGDAARFLAAISSPALADAPRTRLRDSLNVVDASPGSQCPPAPGRRCPTRVGYGLGWAVLEYPGERMYWHTGVDRGERAMVIRRPKTGEAWILASNGANGFSPIIEAAIVLLGDAPLADFLATGRSPRKGSK